MKRHTSAGEATLARPLALFAVIGPLLAAFAVGLFVIGVQVARADDPNSPPSLTADLTSPAGAATYTSGTWTQDAVLIDYTCTGTGVTQLIDLTVSAEGTTNVGSITCSDTYGSDSNPEGPFVVKIDMTKPTLTYNLVNADATTYTPGTWTNQDVTVDWVCDGFAGDVAPMATEPADQTITTEGTTTSSAPSPACADEAGNVADVPTLPEVKIDKTKPTLSLALTNADASTYTPGTWTNQSVTADWTCDGFSGDVSPQDGSGPVDEPISAEGKTTVSSPADCKDTAGNTADVPTLPEVWIDKTAPVLTYTLEDTAMATYVGPPHWTALTVNLVWTCTDPTTNAPDVSGPDLSVMPTDVTYDTSGKHPTSQNATCDDLAGNTSAEVDVDPAEVWIDKDKPYLVVGFAKYKGNGTDTEVPGEQGPFTPASLDTWFNYRVAITVTCMDDHSGVASNSFSTQRLLFTRDGKHPFVLNGACVDNVGHVADIPVGKFVKVDTRMPTCHVTFQSRAKIGETRSIKVYVTGTDATSGVASTQITGITPAAYYSGAALPAPSGTAWMFSGARGRHWTVVGQVVDNAGNVRLCKALLASIR